MGAISKIRQLSPYMMATVAVLFIAFMVIQDSSCTNIRDAARSPENTMIGEVNGVGISLADYERRVRDVIERQRQANQNQEVNDEQVRQQVFDAMVDELLRKQAAEEMGLMVTPQELVDVMLINPPAELQFFKDSTGRFQRELHEDLVTNPDKIVEMLTAQGASVEEAERQRDDWVRTLFEIEDYLRTQKLEEALRNAVGAAASIPSVTLASYNYETQNSTADVRFVPVPADLISDEAAAPSDEEVKAYYEKNKQYYEQKPARKLKYVILRQQPSEKDSARASRRSQKFMERLASLSTPEEKSAVFETEMKAYGGQTFDYQPANTVDGAALTVLASMQNGEVFGPLTTAKGITYMRLDDRRDGENPVVRASHILIQFGDDKAAAKREAVSIMNRAKRGEDFAALATEFSKDPGSAANGGDLNWFGTGRMVKPFEEAAFAANVGDVVGPVETQFGWHIIKVTDRQNTEYKYSEIVIKPVMSTATKQLILKQGAEIEEALVEGQPFDSVASRENLSMMTSPFFARTTPVMGSAAITAWAFENGKGDVIRRDLPNYGIIVGQIVETREYGIKPFDDVVEEVTASVRQIKKLDMLEEKASAIASACKASNDMNAYTSVDSTLELRQMIGARNNGQLQGFGGEFAATQAAFSLPVNSISDPIRGQRAWFVMIVDARQPADMTVFESSKLEQLQNLSNRNRGTAYYTWFNQHKEMADIVDMRNVRD